MNVVLEILKNKYILVALVISFLSTYSLSQPGLPPTHDGEYHVMRFQQFYKVLSEGNIYPRWAPDFNNGFGIPLFNYVYPLPNYIASFFHFLGLSFIDSFKLNMVVASLTGSVFFFLWSRKYWGDMGGLVSSVFYTFSPYHFLDIYVRGSVGEVWALALFPGLLWSFFSYSKTKKINFLLASVLFLFLLIMSHNILALVFFSFFLIYSLFLLLDTKEKKSFLKHLVLLVTLGLFLSAPFWLPALYEARYVVGLNMSNPVEHFPKLYQLIHSSWGYGFSGDDRAGQMSFQIGIANLIVIICSIVLLFITKSKNILFFISSFAFFLFLITPFSSWLWKEMPFSSFVQFPWRLLSVLILISSFLAGSFVRNDLYKRKEKQLIVALLLIVLSVGLSIRYAKAPFHHKRADNYYFSRSNFTNGTNSPGNVFNTKWFDRNLGKADHRIVSRDLAQIEVTKNNSNFIRANIIADKAGTVQTNIAYFPGWKVYVNSIDTKIKVIDMGLFEFDIPKGRSVMEVKFEDTSIRRVSVLLFILGFVLTVGLFMKEKSIRIKK